MNLQHITYLITININNNMLIFIFFTIAVSTNFLFLTEESADPPLTKLQQFDSNTFITTTVLNIIMRLGQCKFDNLNNAYFTTSVWDKDVQFLLIKVNISTKTISSIDKLIVATLMDDNNNLFVISPVGTRDQLFQLNWPNFTSKFTFDLHILGFYKSLYIPNSNLYVFTAHMLTDKDIVGCIVIMSNDNGFKISQIIMIENKILSMYYHNDTIYLITSKYRLIKLCSLSLHDAAINCMITYDIAMEHRAGMIFDDTLYFVSKSDNGSKYWVETNMKNYSYTIRKLPLSISDVWCMRIL